MMRFLAISGSLRRLSTNSALLRAIEANAPDGIAVAPCQDIGGLPIFNPDREGDLTPRAVQDFAAKIDQADGLIISCPEYAHGIPGGLKNALDWLVSREEIPFKPAMLVRASSRSDIALSALQDVLRTMSVALMPEIGISVPLLGKKAEDVDAILCDPETRANLSAALIRFASWVKESR